MNAGRVYFRQENRVRRYGTRVHDTRCVGTRTVRARPSGGTFEIFNFETRRPSRRKKKTVGFFDSTLTTVVFTRERAREHPDTRYNNIVVTGSTTRVCNRFGSIICALPVGVRNEIISHYAPRRRAKNTLIRVRYIVVIIIII